MASPTPAGFNASEVFDGLYQAMAFGAPNDADAQATFFKQPVLNVDSSTDDEGVPFDPDVNIDRTPVSVKRPCAIEYIDAADQIGNFGVRQPSKIKVTLLGPDYDAIRGSDDDDQALFSYMTVAGQKYLYSKEEPVVALGTIDVHTIHCKAEDEL